MNSEMNGLQAIADEAMENGTLHTMRMPPSRDGFETDEEYGRAYDEWWTRMHCWVGTIKEIT